ncbi:MAG: hypothetical protein H3Z53_00680 [archaeon]|nr:hypothetical protein [archaeon]
MLIEVEMFRKRPTIVKILVVIVIVGSILPILAGTMMLIGGMALPQYFIEEQFLGIIAAYYVLVGLIGLVLAWGLWGGHGWAWTITLIVSIIGIIIGLVTLPTGIAGVVIDGIVLYLLMHSDTRRFCGK